MRGKIIGRALQRVEGAENVSGVWLYAADNIRPRMLWGRVLHRSYYHCDPQHRCQPGKKSAWAPASARAHRHMYEKVNDVLSGRGTVSSKIAALIGAKTMSGVFPFWPASAFQYRGHPARFLVHHNRRSWRISALFISNKVKGPMSKKSSR